MLSAVQGIVPLMGVAGPAARGQFLFVAVAFVESNFTVSLVAQHSHTQTHALQYIGRVGQS